MLGSLDLQMEVLEQGGAKCLLPEQLQQTLRLLSSRAW
jgi:hypothetical protein